MRGVKTNKTIFLALLAILAIFLVACQIPQYTPPPTDGEEDVAKELEELTEEISDETEMTPEEKAREEFKKRLLEKQSEVKTPEPVATPEVKEVAPVKKEPVAEVKTPEPVATPEVKEVAPVKKEPVAEVKVTPKAESKTVSTPSKGANGDLTLALNEGDLVALKLKATDPDGDPLAYTFTKPLDNKGRWQTKVGDAGSYDVEVTVSDGVNTVSQTLKLVVKKLNNAPVLKKLSDVSVKEGGTVTLAVEASDADGDELTYKYSGWMSSPTYTTNYNDAGTHEVTVSVSDGKESVSQTVKVTVEDVNRAPTFDWS
jgi:hypothetical protein